MTYTFSDDFNGAYGSPPDPAFWSFETGSGIRNKELQTYTNSPLNCFQDGNGNLFIRAGKTPTGYTSASLKSRFSQYQGVWEARLKISQREGCWPAWWAEGTNLGKWPLCGEVDMVENFGYGSTIETSVNTPNSSGTDMSNAVGRDVHVDSNWHVYRMVWNNKGFWFYRDGLHYYTVRKGALPNWCYSSGQPMFMRLNLAIGGLVGTPPPDVSFPVDFIIDYVRVWK